MIGITRLALLRRGHTPLPLQSLQKGQGFVELRGENADRISRSAQAYGRRGDLARIRRRFEAGLRFFGIEEHGNLVAWQWLAIGAPRYLDELCWEISLNRREAWLRDVFVAPEHRGRGMMATLFARSLDAIGGSAQCYSDVDVSNVASLRAHHKLGFENLAVAWAIQIGARFVIRSRLPPMLRSRAIRPFRRMLILTGEELEWHRRHVA